MKFDVLKNNGVIEIDHNHKNWAIAYRLPFGQDGYLVHPTACLAVRVADEDCYHGQSLHKLKGMTLTDFREFQQELNGFGNRGFGKYVPHRFRQSKTYGPLPY